MSLRAFRIEKKASGQPSSDNSIDGTETNEEYENGLCKYFYFFLESDEIMILEFFIKHQSRLRFHLH